MYIEEKTEEGKVLFIKNQFNGDIEKDVQIRIINYALSNLSVEKFNEVVAWIDKHPNNKINN